eukprot:TRINITY_DN1043_c0_g1_i1.p1 TRINITY_DN1043_c0_g1~~TRINITY_DN1043_c0_g1_i1.p1  ORF type:complete len:533 (+),score=113.24 TRINITY_DN1043_c0_g1_i1:905-2503(+)
MQTQTLPSRHSSTKLKPSIPWGSRTVEAFEKKQQIGEGTYGKVYMAIDRETKETVALKKVRMENEKDGFPITAIREIKILKQLVHENVVQLKEIVTSKEEKQSIYMVFEYMDHDLAGLMLDEGSHWNPTPAQVKCYMKQLLEGLHYCHMNKVLHRDLKGSNLLINNKGQLKLADFGLARPYSDQLGSYTNRVITLWYRPPELLLGDHQYGPQIDMWSAGCILAELVAGKPIFPGKNEVEQIEKIFQGCGTPTPDNWPTVQSLRWWPTFKPHTEIRRNLTEWFQKFANKGVQKECLDLLDRLLTLDPAKRISAGDALDHDYFWSEPRPCDPSDLPKFREAAHEFQAKKRRQSHPAPSQNHNDMKRPRTGNPPNGDPNNSGRGYPPRGSNNYRGNGNRYPNNNDRRPYNGHNNGHNDHNNHNNDANGQGNPNHNGGSNNHTYPPRENRGGQNPRYVDRNRPPPNKDVNRNYGGNDRPNPPRNGERAHLPPQNSSNTHNDNPSRVRSSNERVVTEGGDHRTQGERTNPANGRAPS